MPVTAISPGPVIPISQSVIYALPGSPCVIFTGVACERSNVYTGPFTAWAGSTSGAYNHVGGFVRCTSGNTTIQALKVKMDGTTGTGQPVDLDASYSARIMKDRPSYYWSLNDESGLVAVESVSGANGTISGGVTLNQAGAVGKGMLFDGVDDKIQTIANISIPLVCTIEGWMNTSAAIGSRNPMFSTGGVGGTGNFITVGLGAGRLIVVDTTSTSSSGLLAMPTTGWHQVVATVDGSTVSVYLDGVFDRTQPLSRTIPYAGVCTIGWATGTAAGNGSIDEVAIYPYALSPAQIQSHYLAKFGITNPSSYAAKVVMSGASNYWPLNETSGLVANDVIGNVAGTISGGVTLNQPGVGTSKAMTFDGSTGKIVTGATVPLPLVCTIELWAYVSSTVPIYSPFIETRGPSATDGIASGIWSDSSVFAYGGTEGVSDGPHKVRDNQWHHVVIVANGTTGTIYVDGAFDKTAPLSRVATNKAVMIGTDANPRFWLGSLQDVAIYPRALSATEIAQHYSARLA